VFSLDTPQAMNNLIIAGIASFVMAFVCLMASTILEGFEMFAAGFFAAAVYWILAGMLPDGVDSPEASE